MFRQSSTATARGVLRSSKTSLPAPPPATQGVDPLNPLLPLQGCIISYTGFSVAEREVVNTKVRAMGGEINVDLTEDVTHLLVAKVGSQKYKVAYTLGIAVLNPAWLNKLYDQWCKGDTFDLKTLTEDHILGPLTGCSICVTGYAADVREEIERNTLKYGGRYTSDLHRGKTTHLLCHRATGLKYKSALMWGLHCVPYDWLKDSIKKLERADESKYQIPSNAPTHALNTEVKAPNPVDMDTEPVRPQSVQDQMYLEACYIYLSPEFSAEMTTRLKKMIRMGGGIQVTEYQPSEVTHVVVPSDTLSARVLALFNQDTDLPYIVNYQWLRQSNRACKLLPESEYIVPFPTRSEDGQLKPVRFQGATTWTTDSAFKSSDLNSSRTSGRPRIAAVLAADSNGSSVSSKAVTDGAKLMAYRSATDRNAATTSSGATTPSDTPDYSSPAESRRGLRSRTQSGILTEALGELSVISTTQMPSQDNSLVSKTGLLALEEDMDEEEEESGKSNIFLGLYISAYGWSSQKLVSAIQSETVARGGVFVAEGETPPVPLDRIWTIVPLSRSGQSLQHLKTEILTGCWFERSLETDRVVSRNEHFLNTPIPVLPVPGFEGLYIAVATTLLKEYEYEQIGKAIGHMGATFCDKLNNLTTNLLIADRPTGPKYEFMAKKGKPIVKMRWLQDCIQQSKRLPYDDYILENPSTAGSLIKRSDSDSLLMRPSSVTNSRSNSPFENQLVPVYHAAPSDRPLEGLVIYLHGRVQGDHNEMQDLIAHMGARLLTSFNSSATHFIHQGKRTPEVGREIKMATKHKIFTVSPQWLYKCHETGTRVKESEYREIYDGNHLQTLVISASQPSSASKTGHRGLSKPMSSPSLLTPASTSLPGRIKRSTTATSASQYRGNESSSTQSLHRTAAAVTSSVVVKREISSLNMGPSTSPSSYDMSMPMLTTDQPSLRSMPSGQSFPAVQEEPRYMEDSDIWQPLPKVPVIREQRKRRRVTPPEEGSSSSLTTSSTASEMEGERIDYFSKASRYGPDAIYWDDVEGRQKKRALYESLGYTIPENPLAGNEETEMRQDSLPRDVASQVPRQYFFLLTGILQADRPRFKRTINDLGGVVLEDVNEDHEEWKAKVTHLVANGKNPPRTAKLVAAKEVGAMIVHKSFLIESAEQGQFVDETPHLI
ncbi:topoisomerase (DNA) II binding protein 1 [Entomortierella parvispora]|uniref:Topoisomerase (DNA) II binding protein 1 n=1 Tax=Entomortierella parvispora TaxID=205924 RepID=A0A9P3H1K1_9FUNG|nr:topoisomerase (DNA) II binding protein 1 [Entomortierella parvispora]